MQVQCAYNSLIIQVRKYLKTPLREVGEDWFTLGRRIYRFLHPDNLCRIFWIQHQRLLSLLALHQQPGQLLHLLVRRRRVQSKTASDFQRKPVTSKKTRKAIDLDSFNRWDWCLVTIHYLDVVEVKSIKLITASIVHVTYGTKGKQKYTYFEIASVCFSNLLFQYEKLVVLYVVMYRWIYACTCTVDTLVLVCIGVCFVINLVTLL